MSRISDTIQAARLAIDNAHDLIREHTHGDRHDRYIAVNVKLHHMESVDRDTILDRLDLTPSQKAKVLPHIEDMLTERGLQNLEEFWLESERRYAIEWLGGCTVNPPGYWEGVHDIVKHGGTTMYPYIEKIQGYDDEHTLKLKLWQVEQMNRHDARLRSALERVDRPGFFGRSGGWLALCDVSTVENEIEEVEEALAELGDVATSEYEGINAEADAYETIAAAIANVDERGVELDSMVSDLDLLIQEIETMRDGLDFAAFVEDQAMMEIEQHVTINTLVKGEA